MYVQVIENYIIIKFLTKYCNETLTIEYADEAIESLVKYHKSDDKRYRKLKSNTKFLNDLDKVMSLLRVVGNTSQLAYFGQLHYEKLKYELSGKSSVRIGYNTKYRLIFEEFDCGIRISLIEINERYDDK